MAELVVFIVHFKSGGAGKFAVALYNVSSQSSLQQQRLNGDLGTECQNGQSKTGLLGFYALLEATY